MNHHCHPHRSCRANLGRSYWPHRSSSVGLRHQKIQNRHQHKIHHGTPVALRRRIHLLWQWFVLHLHPRYHQQCQQLRCIWKAFLILLQNTRYPVCPCQTCDLRLYEQFHRLLCLTNPCHLLMQHVSVRAREFREAKHHVSIHHAHHARTYTFPHLATQNTVHQGLLVV